MCEHICKCISSFFLQNMIFFWAATYYLILCSKYKHFCNTSHIDCFCVQPILQPAAPLSPSLPLFSWNPAFIFHCGVAHPANPAPLQPWEGDFFPIAPLLSLQSGGLSGLIYNAAAVDQIFTLTLCAWVYPACREAREEKRENGRLSVTEQQQTEGKKKESWKAVWAGGRRGGG